MILPPVDLYKIKDKYYVVDGNHRVAAAKEIGQIYIDAYVTEFLPTGDTPQHLLWRSGPTLSTAPDYRISSLLSWVCIRSC